MKTKRSESPELDLSAGLLRAMGDTVRLRLLCLLSGDREVSVGHLHAALELPQPKVSRHLAYLRRHGVVAGRKEGLRVYYRLARPKSPLQVILMGCLDDRLGDWEILEADRARLETLMGRRRGKR